MIFPNVLSFYKSFTNYGVETLQTLCILNAQVKNVNTYSILQEALKK